MDDMVGLLRSVSGSLCSLFASGSPEYDWHSALTLDELRCALTSLPKLQLFSAPMLLLPQAATDVVDLASARGIRLSTAGIDPYTYDSAGRIVLE